MFFDIQDVYQGVFDISSVGSGYTSVDEDGQTVSGTLAVASDGGVNYTGDLLGTNASDRFWTTGYNPVGTWHVKLTFISGTNSRSGGTANDTWTAVGSFSMSFSKASAGGPDQATGTWTLAFSDDGGSTTHDSKSITITMQEQAP